jgi:hypothetical protein
MNAEVLRVLRLRRCRYIDRRHLRSRHVECAVVSLLPIVLIPFTGLPCVGVALPRPHVCWVVLLLLVLLRAADYVAGSDADSDDAAQCTEGCPSGRTDPTSA